MAKMSHKEQIVYLKKIEGQVRGLQKMIDDGRYCVDILTQIQSTIGALMRVREKVFSKHLAGCVAGALKSKNTGDTYTKIGEITKLLKRFTKNI